MTLPALLVLLASGYVFSPQTARKAGPSFDTIAAAAQTARDKGDVEKAVSLYRQGVRMRPGWEDGWWNLGSIAYDSDKWMECASAFHKLTAVSPDGAPGWTMQGLCEYRLRNFSAALDALARVETMKFQVTTELARSARLHYALVLTKMERYEKAIVILTELTRIDKKSPEICVAAGIAAMRKPWLPPEVPEGDRDKVIKIGEAMGLAMEMDYKNAIDSFESAIREYPKESNLHFRFGGYMMLQNPERGIQEIEKAIELEPSNLPALVSLAMIYLKRDEPALGKPYAQRAVDASPGDFASHVALGRVLLALGDGTGAVVELERAVKLAPESPDAHYNLATAYARTGRKTDAAVEQEAFKKLRKLIDSPQ